MTATPPVSALPRSCLGVTCGRDWAVLGFGLAASAAVGATASATAAGNAGSRGGKRTGTHGGGNGGEQGGNAHGNSWRRKSRPFAGALTIPAAPARGQAP